MKWASAIGSINLGVPLGDYGDDVQDWWNGTSSAAKQYHYQSNLDAANRAWSAKQAELAYQRQRDYFDYVASYNTPAKQMERLRAAGLNPHLVYGSGASAVQAATSSAPMASGGNGSHAPIVGNRTLDGLGFLTDLAFKAISAKQEQQRIAQSNVRLGNEVAKTQADIAHTRATTEKTLEEASDVKRGLANPWLKYITRTGERLGDYVGSNLARLYDGLTGNISGRSWFSSRNDSPSKPVDTGSTHTIIVKPDGAGTKASFDGGKHWYHYDRDLRDYE